MAKEKKINLQDLGAEELLETLEETQLHLRKLKFNHAVSVLEDTNSIKNTRRDIARIKTEMRAREIAEAKK